MDNRSVFKHERGFILGKYKVFEYYNTNKTKSIDVMTSTETQFRDVAVYSTIGLSKTELGLTSQGLSVRVELIGVGDKDDDTVANIISTVGFDIMDTKNCGYGMTVTDVIRQYNDTLEVRHVVLLEPVFWEYYTPLEKDGEHVSWLLCVPITDNELRFIREKGIDEFETLLSEQSGDITDIHRKSFV